jgi:hypothetical protein
MRKFGPPFCQVSYQRSDKTRLYISGSSPLRTSSRHFKIIMDFAKWLGFMKEAWRATRVDKGPLTSGKDEACGPHGSGNEVQKDGSAQSAASGFPQKLLYQYSSVEEVANFRTQR